MKNTSLHSGLLLPIILASLVGAGVSVISTVMTSRAIDNYAANLLEDRRFVAFFPQKAPAFPGTYTDALELLRNDATRSLAVILPASSDSALPSQWYDSTDAKGVGVVVSSDGWVLTTSAVFPETLSAKNVDVWVEKKRYVVERVTRDTTTDLVLLKLGNASGLPAVGFAPSEDVADGDMLFVFEDEDSFLPTVLENADEEILFGPQQAEAFRTSWKVQDTLASGLPILASTGELLGFTLGDGFALPLHHSRGFVQDVVRTGAPREAAFGAYVVDLSRVYNITNDLRQGRYSGALIMNAISGASALPSGSPALLAGIRPFDIVLDVDGDAVTETRSLAEILGEYDPGEVANVRVLRDGATVVIPVTLGDAKSLVY